MTKAQLVEKVSLLNDIDSKAAAARVVEFIIETITEELINKGEVNLSGLGKFYTKTQAARSGVSAFNGKPYSSPEKTVPKFKPSTILKRAVNK